MRVEPLAAGSGAPSQGRLGDLRPLLVASAETVGRLLPGFDQVSIAVVERGGRNVSWAQVGDVVGDLDRLQYGLAEGPCLDSIRGDLLVVAPHIRRDTRWSRYVSSAAAFGLRAQMAAPLRRRGGRPVGCLNVYSTTRGDIPAAAPWIAEALAVQAAGVLDSSREIENLHRALAARKDIGIALGLLMAQYEVSEPTAFAVLKRCSAHTRVKVRDLAARMVAEGNASLVMPPALAPRGKHHVLDTPARDSSPPLRRRIPAPRAASMIEVDDDPWFQVTYVDPGGRTYEMTLQAPTATEAVRLADAAPGDVGGIGIGDHLLGDGVTVGPPARLHLERVTHQADGGLGLVVTDPDGTITRRHLDPPPSSRRRRPTEPQPGGQAHEDRVSAAAPSHVVRTAGG